MSGLFRLSLALLVAVALTACAMVPEGDPAAPFPQRADAVHIAPDLEGVVVEALRETLAMDGTRRVNLTARSTSYSRQTLRYRALWFDNQGMEMRTILSNWNRRVIEAGQTFEATLVAPGAAAQSFRIELEKSPH
jgi:uncharacterized protein YcfL